jgi:hypothetical protein
MLNYLAVSTLGFLFLAAALFSHFVAKPPSQMSPVDHLQRTSATSEPSAQMCLRPVAQNPHPSGRAYHQGPPTAVLPPTLDPAKFAGNKAAFVAYSLAAKIPELLYQEPCYCGCNESIGHESLLDCYTGSHGGNCPKCQGEVFFIYEQSKAGKTPAEIRDAMENGDVWKVDVNKYAEAHYTEHKKPAP